MAGTSIALRFDLDKIKTMAGTFMETGQMST